MIADAPVRRYASVDSTNLEAQRLVAEGERGPLWIVADEQTAGRGRQGRNWASLPGNLYSTFILTLEGAAATVPQLGFVVALAVHDVASVYVAPERARLKWPNDCLVDGAKLSGILCEVFTQKPVTVGLGCGINVEHAPIGLAYPAAALSHFGKGPKLPDVFGLYQRALDYRFRQWSSGFPGIAAEWGSRALGIGEEIVVTDGAARLQGQFSGLADDGAMIVDAAEGRRLVRAGDVTIPSLEALRRSSL
ncbi:MAG: biotin--[acetyl-CoA-carboxylase] ligase [Proteobacteria bacterium]|nr:biotin--[acetyl-CoA-carboxylase] ligase [Pseudomonadota bacterium]